jgi:hypothetical protein
MHLTQVIVSLIVWGTLGWYTGIAIARHIFFWNEWKEIAKRMQAKPQGPIVRAEHRGPEAVLPTIV